MIRVTIGKPKPAQLSIPWGHSWYDFACDWAKLHGWKVEEFTPGQRVRINGQWMRVTWSEGAGEFQISYERGTP